MKKGFWKMLATGIAAAVVGGCVEHDEGADASREIGFDVAAAESRAPAARRRLARRGAN